MESVKKFLFPLVLATLFASFQQSFGFSLGFGFGSPAPSFVGVFGRQDFGERLDMSLSAGYSSYSDLDIFSISPQLRFFPTSDRTDFLRFWVGGGVNFLLFEGQGDLQNLEIDSESALPLLLLNLGIDFDVHDNIALTIGAQFHFPVKLIFPLVEFGYKFD